MINISAKLIHCSRKYSTTHSFTNKRKKRNKNTAAKTEKKKFLSSCNTYLFSKSVKRKIISPLISEKELSFEPSKSLFLFYFFHFLLLKNSIDIFYLDSIPCFFVDWYRVRQNDRLHNYFVFSITSTCVIKEIGQAVGFKLKFIF